MRAHQASFAIILATAVLAPISARAQFIATPFHVFEVRSPNSLNSVPGLRVGLGAFGPNGISGTATRTGAESCDGPLSLPLSNLGIQNIPTQAYGRYVPTSSTSVCTQSWRLNLTVGGQRTIVNTQDLVGFKVLPFVSNISLTSAAGGKFHTFNWAAVPGVTSMAVQVWDRSVMPAQAAQLVSTQSFSGTTTSFVINLNRAGPYLSDRAYTLDLLQTDERNDASPTGSAAKALSQSRTYFDFILPSQPLTNDPVFLPIVEYVAGNPLYTFTVTVDGTGTFVIDPDIATGYNYRTGAGNPNFRTVTLPNVGDGKYTIEVFDSATNQYRAPINVVAAQLVDFIGQGFPQGVSSFRVKGIETSAGLGVGNPGAFPTALQFTGPGTFTGTMIPITSDKTVTQNIACGSNIIAGLSATQVTGRAQQALMVGLLNTAAQSQVTNPNLSFNALTSVISRIDGCSLRGSPDTISTQGAGGMDFVTSCPAQSLAYACLVDGRAQLTALPVR